MLFLSFQFSSFSHLPDRQVRFCLISSASLCLRFPRQSNCNRLSASMGGVLLNFPLYPLTWTPASGMVSPKVRHDSSIGNGSLIKLPGKSSSTKVPFHYLSQWVSQIPWSDVVNLMQKATAYTYLLTALPGEWQFPLRFALPNSRK